jgi:uncharacterized membrane protein YdfJ with MMPL/SSD domain
MRHLAHGVVRHPWLVVIAWVAGIAALSLFGPSFGAAPRSTLSLPAGTESARAGALERAHFAGGAFLLLVRSDLAMARQIGLVVVIGVLLDTFLVRPVLVPALASLLRTGRPAPASRALEAAL